MPFRLDLDVETAAQHLAAELGDGAHEHDVAVIEQRDAVADALDPLEQMRRQQDAHPAVLEIANDREQFDGRLRIETGGRLIEDRDLRLLHEDFGKCEPLPHAARECLHAVVGNVGKPDVSKRRGDLLLALLSFEPDQARDIAQVVGRGEIVVEADLIGHIADATFHDQRLTRRIVPEHDRLPIRNVGQAEQHQDGRRLAGAVRAEQSENLALRDGERDSVHHGDAVIALGELMGLDEVFGHRRPNLATAPTRISSAAPMMPTPMMPHCVEVATVTRKVAEADSPRALARNEVT